MIHEGLTDQCGAVIVTLQLEDFLIVFMHCFLSPADEGARAAGQTK